MISINSDAGHAAEKNIAYIARMVHPPRVVGWIYMLALVGSVRWSDGSWFLWTFLVVNCLVWPHIAHHIEITSRSSRRAVLFNLFIDSFLVGIWISVVSFRLLPTATMIGAVALNLTSMGGIRHLLKGSVAVILGTTLSGLLFGFSYDPETSVPTIAISIIGMVLYTSYVAYVAYSQAIRLHNLRKETEKIAENLKQTQQQFTDAAHHAGMAEVAASVLHNVGNALNSVSISAEVIHRNLRESQILPLMNRVVTLIRENRDHIGTYLTQDERGKKIPDALCKTNDQIQLMYDQMETEVKRLRQNIFAVSDILAAHSEYAEAHQFFEERELAYLVGEALRIQSERLKELDIDLIRELKANPIVHIEKAKFIQIMVNLINNACDSLMAHRELEKRRIEIHSKFLGKDRIQLEMRDNGMGIADKDLAQVFNYGFTTRHDGRGFGLHFCANAVAQMQGAIDIRSPGIGQGASVFLDLPIIHPKSMAQSGEHTRETPT